MLKKEIEEMNKVALGVITIICAVSLFTGIVYATSLIIKSLNRNSNINFNASSQEELDKNTSNNIWIGTFELAWKELSKMVGQNGKIELDDETAIAKDLNESNFSEKMLSKEDYKITINKNKNEGYDIYATLDKNLNFIHAFDNFSNDFNTYTFGNNAQNIKYFGINNASLEKLNENVEVLFYNKATDSDFAVKLKTKEGDEIILYRTDDKKTFKEYYNDINIKKEKYEGEKIFAEKDELLIPYINVNGIVCYDELEGKYINNTNMFIREAVQNVNFSLNESGCNIDSKATMTTSVISATERYFKFTDTFIVFAKEKDADFPYFSLKVDNADILEKKEDLNEPQIVDYTIMKPGYNNVEKREYKFYEDENYEYFYPTQKNELVEVYYKNGDVRIETVEEALKNNRISIELLDKYDVEYIKKEK